MNILLTGGAGYIGSHTLRALKQAGHKVCVYDNLSAGRRAHIGRERLIKGDIGDSGKLLRLLSKERFDAVMHFAAYTSVPESVAQPSKYYDNNFVKTLALLDCCVKAKVKYFIFSSTAAVYGATTAKKVAEGAPKTPLNPYGKSKLMCEGALEDYARAYGLKYCVLRYFNACGADDRGDIGEVSSQSHLLPIILNAGLEGRQVKVFGTNYKTKDGTCVRDYIHVNDLAKAHILALKYLAKGGKSTDFNFGLGSGVSIKEMLSAVEKHTGLKLKIKYAPSRAGDSAYSVADSLKARKTLGWKADYNLERIIKTSFAWEKKKCTKK